MNRSKTGWEAALEPFADEYADLVEKFQGWLRAMPEEELDVLEAALNMPDRKNAWWAAYRVAQMLEQYVAGERVRRNRGEPVEPRPSAVIAHLGAAKGSSTRRRRPSQR